MGRTDIVVRMDIERSSPRKRRFSTSSFDAYQSSEQSKDRVTVQADASPCTNQFCKLDRPATRSFDLVRGQFIHLCDQCHPRFKHCFLCSALVYRGSELFTLGFHAPVWKQTMLYFAFASRTPQNKAAIDGLTLDAVLPESAFFCRDCLEHAEVVGAIPDAQLLRPKRKLKGIHTIGTDVIRASICQTMMAERGLSPVFDSVKKYEETELARLDLEKARNLQERQMRIEITPRLCPATNTST